jgi:5'-nucleotidase / UDP-sugar diphosphatase
VRILSDRSLLKLVALITVLVLLSSLSPAAGAQGSDFVLTIVHTNDTHAHIAQFDKNGGTCKQEDADQGNCFGGVARRVTMINRIRAEGGNMILVDAGDQFQGTLFYTQYKGQETVPFVNAMGYQAMAVGNHEFDDGPAVFARFIKGADFPVLSANIDASQEPILAGLIQPYTVLEVGGQKIGVVGCTIEETSIQSKPGPNVIFNPIEPAVKAAVAELQRMGINKIVALSHAGILRDKQIAAALDGIDVIVDGHSHTYLSNTDDTAWGPYPVVVKSPGGAPVLIVSDFWMAKYLGRLDVTFDASGVATSWQGNPILLDASVPEDPATLAEVQALAEPLKALTAQVIGSAAVDLDGERASCRFKECTLGNLISDAVLWATASLGTQIVFENGGNIRVSIPAGKITRGQVLEVLPYGNMVATFELKGADVWAALENSVSRAENPENEGTGRFMQVAGVRYTWNATRPVGSRILKVEVKSQDGSYGPLDPNAIYKIAANNYVRQGGDGYDVFARNAINPYDYGYLEDKVLSDYIMAHSPMSAQLEGRIIRDDTAVPADLPATGTDNPARAPLALVLLGSAVVLMMAGVLIRWRAERCGR